MIIKRKKAPDSHIEKQIITNMVVSTEFLRGILVIYKPEFLSLPYARIIAGWCLEYFEQYQLAPKEQIQDLFRFHTQHNNFDSTKTEIISVFLSGLSNEYKEDFTINSEYLLDQAEVYFRRQALANLELEISSAITSGKIDQGEEIIAKFHRIVRQTTSGVDPIANEDIIINAFEKQKGLFSLPGDLGKAVGPFERGFLVGVVGAKGKGKSWWLQEIAIRGLLAGLNVLFISLEMTEEQMIRRIHHNLSGLPNKAGKLLLPVFDCELNQNGGCEREERCCNIELLFDGVKPDFEDAPNEYVPCAICRGSRRFRMDTWFIEKDKGGLTATKAVRKGKSVVRFLLRGKRLKLIQFPAGGIDMRGLQTNLYNWEYYDNFIPDMIITDYADKFAPNDKQLSPIDKIEEIWALHKALALDRHCIIVTGSQSNTARTGKTIGQGDWARNIEKLNLVDTAFALNQTFEDKKAGIMRIGILARRHDDFNLLQEVVVLQHLGIGKPYLDSYLVK